MTPPRVPGFRWLPVRNHGGKIQPIGACLHVQVGNGSLFGQFNNPASQTSSTVWLAKGGGHEQYMELDDKPWTQGVGNHLYASGECEGRPSELMTGDQLDGFAEFYATGHRAFGWPLSSTDVAGAPGLICHGYPTPGGGFAGRPDWGGHPCPGSLRAAQRPEILRRAALLLGDPSGGVDVPLNVAVIKPGADVGHPDEVAVIRALTLVINPKADLSTPAKWDGAIRYFQEVKGLGVDGWVGPATMRVLVETACAGT